MPRQPRNTYEGAFVHVNTRGNDRQGVYFDRADRLAFLQIFDRLQSKYEWVVYAWVLMTNHFHLLATPSYPDSVARAMQQTGRRYVPYFNRRHDRTGGLWEGRYRAHLVDTEQYWFRCLRYIELNPVRASLTSSPRDHPWSSYHANACGATDKLLNPHALYIGLGQTALERQAAHRSLIGTPLTEAELASIRNAMRTGLSGAELPEAALLPVAS